MTKSLWIIFNDKYYIPKLHVFCGKMEEMKVSVGGRVVIPKKMRKILKIGEGEKILISIDDKKLVIRSKDMVEKPVEKLYGSVKVKPEKNPKREAREWMKKRIEEDL